MATLLLHVSWKSTMPAATVNAVVKALLITFTRTTVMSCKLMVISRNPARLNTPAPSISPKCWADVASSFSIPKRYTHHGPKTIIAIALMRKTTASGEVALVTALRVPTVRMAKATPAKIAAAIPRIRVVAASASSEPIFPTSSCNSGESDRFCCPSS